MPTALLSVYDKTGVVEFAKRLTDWGWKIIASGGTAKKLSEAGIAVRDVAELVGGGPILGHRVVTLSREVHAGLLAQDTAEDREELKQLGIPFIDLVYVTLYPLVEEMGKADATLESVTEKTDIGGPTMLRSAAKGRRLVISCSQDIERVLEHLEEHGGKPAADTDLLRGLAHKAERLVAGYALASAIALGVDPSEQPALAHAYEYITGSSLPALYFFDKRQERK